MIKRSNSAPLLLLALLAACTTDATNTRPAKVPPAPARSAEEAAAIQADPPLAQILGKSPEAILAMFGAATIDRTEAQTRHIQFGGSPCILDIYFYPETDGAPALAHYAEARMIDGKPAAAGDCITRRLRDIAEERGQASVS